MTTTYVTTDTLPTPNAGDEVYIQHEAPSITGNLDWSATAGAAIFDVAPDYSGNIGSAASPLKISCSTHFLFEGRNICYWNSDDSGSNTTALCVVDGSGVLHIGGGTVTRLEVANGTVWVGASAVITNLRVMGGLVYLLDDTSTDATLIENYGGTVHVERGGSTTITHVRGSTVIEGRGATETITTANVYGPGMVLRKVGTTGVITTMNALGGIPDVNHLQKKVTITTLNLNRRLPGAQDFAQHPMLTTTPAEYW